MRRREWLFAAAGTVVGAAVVVAVLVARRDRRSPDERLQDLARRAAKEFDGLSMGAWLRGSVADLDEAREALVRVCDLCETEPATVHLVATFHDAEERELGGGSTAMRADYCQACADQLEVGR